MFKSAHMYLEEVNANNEEELESLKYRMAANAYFTSYDYVNDKYVSLYFTCMGMGTVAFCDHL